MRIKSDVMIRKNRREINENIQIMTTITYIFAAKGAFCSFLGLGLQ